MYPHPGTHPRSGGDYTMAQTEGGSTAGFDEGLQDEGVELWRVRGCVSAQGALGGVG